MKKRSFKLMLVGFHTLIIFFLLFFLVSQWVNLKKHQYSNGLEILQHHVSIIPEATVYLKIKNTTNKDILPLIDVKISRTGEIVKHVQFNNLEPIKKGEVKEIEVNLLDKWRFLEFPRVKVEVLTYEGKLLASVEGRVVASSLTDVKKVLLALSGFVGLLAGSTFLVKRFLFSIVS